MTVGTAIFLSILVLCATFLCTLGIGVHVQNKKTSATAKLGDSFTKLLQKELNKSLSKKE